jgi:hypothetical protein
MGIFTIHLRRHGLDPDRDIVVLKDGFSWPAFVAGSLWALWHRMWWVAFGLIVGAAGLSAFGSFVLSDPYSPSVLTGAFALLSGLLAHDLRAWTMQRQGFILSGVVTADNADDALLRYLDEDPDLASEIVQTGIPA